MRIEDQLEEQHEMSRQAEKSNSKFYSDAAVNQKQAARSAGSYALVCTRINPKIQSEISSNVPSAGHRSKDKRDEMRLAVKTIKSALPTSTSRCSKPRLEAEKSTLSLEIGAAHFLLTIIYEIPPGLASKRRRAFPGPIYAARLQS